MIKNFKTLFIRLCKIDLMTVFLFRILSIMILNYILILQSKYIDTYQLIEDLSNFVNSENNNINTSYLTVCFSVSILTNLLLIFFKPFIEIYLLHYSRYLFYLLVSLISLSSVYIIFRVYGYSRLWILIYLIFTTIFLMFSEKFKKSNN